MDEALLELLPISVRGKELAHGVKMVGGFSWKYTCYESMMIVESDRNGIIVSFRGGYQSSSTS